MFKAAIITEKKKFEYDVKEIYSDTYLVNEFYSTMFVLVGSESALVIDCGTGVSDFKKVIEGITDKKYRVMMTHSHVDHIGGRGQFDEIYVSQKDARYIKGVNTAQRKGYAQITKLSLGTHFSDIHIQKVEKEPKVNLLHEGDTFDLGGRTVKVFETPGHTVGSVSFLDVESKTLFIGDVANGYLFMWLPHCTSVEEMVRTHEKILGMDGVDTIWSSHATTPQTKKEVEQYRENAVELMKAQQHNKYPSLIKVKENSAGKLFYRTGMVFDK